MSWLTVSGHTMSLTPAEPRRAAYSKAASVLSGYTEAVDRPTLMAGRTVSVGALARLQQCQWSQCDQSPDGHCDQRAADVLGFAHDTHAHHQAEDHQHRQHERDDVVPLPQLVERDEQARAERDRDDALADDPGATQERRHRRRRCFGVVFVLEVDVVDARGRTAPGQVVGDGLAAEKWAR